MFDAVKDADMILKENIGKTVERLENEAEEFSESEAFNALVALSDLKATVREFEIRINVLLTTWMRINGEKVLEFGDMTAERKFSATRKNWQHGTLLEAVINKSLSQESTVVVDPASGEVIDLTTIARPIIDAVVENVTKAARIGDWRVTALRSMLPGMDPDNFCEVEKAERVSIRKRNNGN